MRMSFPSFGHEEEDNIIERCHYASSFKYDVFKLDSTTPDLRDDIIRTFIDGVHNQRGSKTNYTPF